MGKVISYPVDPVISDLFGEDNGVISLMLGSGSKDAASIISSETSGTFDFQDDSDNRQPLENNVSQPPELNFPLAKNIRNLTAEPGINISRGNLQIEQVDAPPQSNAVSLTYDYPAYTAGGFDDSGMEVEQIHQVLPGSDNYRPRRKSVAHTRRIRGGLIDGIMF